MSNEITSAIIGGAFTILAAMLTPLINHLLLQRRRNSRDAIDTKLDVSQENKHINRFLKFLNKPLIYGCTTLYSRTIPFVLLIWAFYVPPGNARTIYLIASSWSFSILVQSIIENYTSNRMLNHLDIIGDELAQQAREELVELTRVDADVKKLLDEATTTTTRAERMIAEVQTIQANVDAALAKVSELIEQNQKGIQEFERLSDEHDMLSRKQTALQTEIVHQSLIRIAHLAGQIDNQLRSKPQKD